MVKLYASNYLLSPAPRQRCRQCRDLPQISRAKLPWQEQPFLASSTSLAQTCQHCSLLCEYSLKAYIV
jgi:hypothetical protein